ncbi:pyruvate/2-oxoglutarate dehydrogenase complex dihydrolipoamide acyltransferase (E2) component [Microbacterium terrae]|uniref:biotin/lipoyl-containing protein n=1 Tax=Microbacterium terrae TaxID=69369 RepID=UPI001B3AFE8F|nr:biotin/lipoyl-containing protein [Microbacterium terrae]MBP1079458.1 pyruvate/2-oxoglutarate dehydrogenase complex dihydrolipoamide acyltransferase (E2) component [Microbacterium terrae]
MTIPKVSMAAEEVVFVEWLVADGATINVGDAIYSVETDKIEMEIEAAAGGILRHGEAVGDETYEVGAQIGRIEQPA